MQENEVESATSETVSSARYDETSPTAGAIGNQPKGLISCLDHGFVRLVDFMGGDISIVRAARVSYDAAWRAGEDEGSDTRLLNYLWKHAHTSPFEAVTLTFEVKAPIFIFRQWHRHRTWGYNELSARYRELPEEFYLPDPRLIGEQSGTNKQTRIIHSEEDVPLPQQRQIEVDEVKKHCKNAFELYRDLLNLGWPRELARSVLPVNTYSHMFATVNLLNLFRFLTLRDDAHAQYEIQVYAQAMKELAKQVAPVAVAAFEKSRSAG
jgi:thymidylate synthase (FAD)